MIGMVDMFAGPADQIDLRNSIPNAQTQILEMVRLIIEAMTQEMQPKL